MSKLLHYFGIHKYNATRRGLRHISFGVVARKYYCKYCGKLKSTEKTK